MNIQDIDERFESRYITRLTVPLGYTDDRNLAYILRDDRAYAHAQLFGGGEYMQKLSQGEIVSDRLVAGAVYAVEVIGVQETVCHSDCRACLEEYGALFTGVQGLLLFGEHRRDILLDLLVMATEYQDPTYVVSFNRRVEADCHFSLPTFLHSFDKGLELHLMPENEYSIDLDIGDSILCFSGTEIQLPLVSW